jgi:hypothetical protein
VAAGRVGLRVRWLKGDKGGPEMAEVLGSLVLGEQKTKDPGGDGGFVSKQNESPGGGGCDSFCFKRVSSDGCLKVGARKGEVV